jgi:hypothetical protein
VGGRCHLRRRHLPSQPHLVHQLLLLLLRHRRLLGSLTPTPASTTTCSRCWCSTTGTS